MNTVTRSFLRYMLRRRSLTALQFLGITLGVAATMGIILSARASLSSFSTAVDFLRGQATHSLQRPAGPLEENILTELMRDPAVESFSPVIERQLRHEDGEVLRIMGVDPLRDREIRASFFVSNGSGKEAPDWREALSFLIEEKSVYIDSSLSQSLDIFPGDLLETTLGSFAVLGVFPNPSGESLVLIDISQAQALFGLEGFVDRVDLILDDEASFLMRWEEGFLIESKDKRRKTLSGMLRAFRLNLEALSLLSLFVGIFLIYNTAMFAVVSRKKDAGILRSLGAQRSEIAAAFLTEILLLGAFGGLAGGILGYFLSKVLTVNIGGSISDLYFFLKPSPPTWSPWIILAGVLVGSLASLLGSLAPLQELIRLDPVRTLSGRTADRRSILHVKRVALAGAGILLLSLALFFFSSNQVYIGFAGAFGFQIAASLLTGLMIVLLHPFTKRILHRLGGLPGKVAAGNVHLNLDRTSVAVAAFLVALSMSIGLSLMIGSFRYSVQWWLNRQISADLYISSMDEKDVPLGLYQELSTWEEIAGLDPYRNVLINYQDTITYVSGVNASVLQKFTEFGWLEGGDENWEKVKNGAVIVSESFARRFSVDSGDWIILEGVEGPEELEVAAVYYDYTSEHGIIMMDRSTYLRFFKDKTINSLGVFIDPDRPDKDRIIERVTAEALNWELPVFTRDGLHRNALKVFDTTFAVTRSMRLIAILVAFFGIAGAILTLFIERQRDFGIYRALGFSTFQVAGITLMEGLTMGLLSFLLSVVVGTGMALILIDVINMRSFHWTVFFHPMWTPYLAAGATAVLASLGASIYPILKAWRTYPQMQIREE